jgi:hypothetical protein
MRRLLAVLALAVITVGGTAHADAPTTARLTITAVGADMEFRTIGLTPGFTLTAGQSRTFRRLPPGTYVVIQAPPVGVWTQVGPNQWEVTGGMQIQCSDGASSNQYDLVAGDQLSCTFTAGL